MINTNKIVRGKVNCKVINRILGDRQTKNKNWEDEEFSCNGCNKNTNYKTSGYASGDVILCKKCASAVDWEDLKKRKLIK